MNREAGSQRERAAASSNGSEGAQGVTGEQRIVRERRARGGDRIRRRRSRPLRVVPWDRDFNSS